MEEKRILTNEQLEAELTSARTKEKIANVLIYGAGAAMVAMFYLKNIPLGIFFLVLLLAGGYLAAKSDGVTKKAPQRADHQRRAAGGAGRCRGI